MKEHPLQAIEDLRQTVARLRAPGGCPWDREQTHQSLTRCLIEETSELLDTIDREDMPHMLEELGDVLLQVVFHAQLAEEQGHFNLSDVARANNDKLIRRHPHVFGQGQKLDTSDAVLSQWELIKAHEKQPTPTDFQDLADGPQPDPIDPREALRRVLPPALPATLFAIEALKKMPRFGLRNPDCPNEKEIQQAAQDLDESNAGHRLLVLLAACRQRKIDPEAAIRLHVQKLIDNAHHE